VEYIKIVQLKEEVRYQTVAVVTKYDVEYIKVRMPGLPGSVSTEYLEMESGKLKVLDTCKYFQNI
jgi:hypothetical protein